MPRGLLFGPDLPAGKDRPDLPPKFKKTKRKTKRKATSRSKGEARSKVQRAKKGEERKKKREEWLLMRAQRREEKQRKAEDEPVVKKVKAKRDPKSHHGTEQVDVTIIKLLGKSHKTPKKLAVKSKGEKVEEVAGPKWRHGMREARHESRSVKVQPPKKSSEKMEKSQPKAAVSEVGPVYEAGVGALEPMPPCMKFYQVRRQ